MKSVVALGVLLAGLAIGFLVRGAMGTYFAAPVWLGAVGAAVAIGADERLRRLGLLLVAAAAAAVALLLWWMTGWGVGERGPSLWPAAIVTSAIAAAALRLALRSSRRQSGAP